MLQIVQNLMKSKTKNWNTLLKYKLNKNFKKLLNNVKKFIVKFWANLKATNSKL